MSDHDRALAAAHGALLSLRRAATHLSIACALAPPGSGLRGDALVLTDAIERELEVLHAILQRHC